MSFVRATAYKHQPIQTSTCRPWFPTWKVKSTNHSECNYAHPLMYRMFPTWNVKSTTWPSSPFPRYQRSSDCNARPKCLKLSVRPYKPRNASSSTLAGSASAPRAMTPVNSGLG